MKHFKGQITKYHNIGPFILRGHLFAESRHGREQSTRFLHSQVRRVEALEVLKVVRVVP